MPQDNQFIFKHSEKLAGVTVLNAVMRDFSYEKHAHEEIALGVTLAGQQDFFCKGVRYKSTPGNILLLNPEDVHDGNPGNESALKYTMLYLHPTVFTPLIKTAGNKNSSSYEIQGNLLQDSLLKSRILKLARLISLNKSSSLELESHLYEIAELLSKKIGHWTPNQRTNDKDSLLIKAKDYIHDNVACDLSIDDLSNLVNISKYHFIRLFRNQFGITPHKYVLNCRVNQARQSLEKGQPPSFVAHLYGFSDVSHLNRHFKRAYGLTPKQYQIQFSG